MKRRRVVIVGGGITGLTTAYKLLAKGDGFDVTLFEAADRLGGKIRTVRRDGLVLDGGPDAFVTQKPQAIDLCRELGLGDRLIETTPANRRVFIMRAGELIALPEGMVLAIPTRVLPLARSRLFSPLGMGRMGLDLLLPRGGEEDESISSFIGRRLGREALERLAEPLLGGIYAGDPRELSIRATFPQLVELERKHRSLVLGMLRSRKPGRRGPPPSAFMSLRTGVADLVDCLGERIRALGGTVHLSTSVDQVERRETFAVRVSRADASDTVLADSVVLAAPLHVAARLLAPIDARGAEVLAGVPHISTATALLAFRRVDVPGDVDAVGVVLPQREGLRALALTFVTSKWAGRAPDGTVVFRVFLGGHAHPGDASESDDNLICIAQTELRRVLRITAEPTSATVFRFPLSSPQPLVGHGARMRELAARVATHAGLYVGGSAIDGIGIPDCVKQGTTIANAIASAHQS
jgi:oxygen-dependent protoporphyrinogen oxidase